GGGVRDLPVSEVGIGRAGTPTSAVGRHTGAFGSERCSCLGRVAEDDAPEGSLLPIDPEQESRRARTSERVGEHIKTVIMSPPGAAPSSSSISLPSNTAVPLDRSGDWYRVASAGGGAAIHTGRVLLISPHSDGISLGSVVEGKLPGLVTGLAAGTAFSLGAAPSRDFGVAIKTGVVGSSARALSNHVFLAIASTMVYSTVDAQLTRVAVVAEEGILVVDLFSGDYCSSSRLQIRTGDIMLNINQ
ncbi:hypothetical protein FOZ63_007947, partial [Perkinsus olseni]